MTRGRIPGLRGTLLSPHAAAAWLDGQRPAAAAPAVAGWAARTLAALGPSSSDRRRLEALEELFLALGYGCRESEECRVAVNGSTAIALFAFDWNRPMLLTSRACQRAAIDQAADWCAGFNGLDLAIADVRRDAPRRVSTVSLEDLATHAAAARLAAALLDARACAGGALASAVRASDAASLEARRALRAGVQDSLGALQRVLPFDASLAVLFRLLFVLFAESRALVPIWHRVYRDHYSLASLALARESRGTWAALEARRRLLGRGCRAGSLHVHGFNGRLFAAGRPRRWAGSARLESRLDAPAARALAALVEYRPARGGARRVRYDELDVEELGTIYERVLDLDPAGDGRIRKESGSFYTPRPLTEFIVRRTLAPLVAGASSRRILALRVLDPAMGSGAFLVAALRFLAPALEAAMIEEGTLPERDITEADRLQLRRSIAQHCLYGVDINPTAAMLARLSLWLATLSPEKPLGFLDHHLKCGNSVVGIDPGTARTAPGASRGTSSLPLFDDADVARALRGAATRAAALDAMDESTVDAVRDKQRVFRALAARGPAAAWKTLADVWCAWWFTPAAERADAREYRALADGVLRRSHVLPPRRRRARLDRAASIARREGVFHWPLEFPDVCEQGGFDAIVGNPPWEMLRAGSGSEARAPLNEFVRRSGAFTLATGGHVNLYQLFIERSLQLLRDGGRLGMVVPWSLFTDDGSAPLRAAIFDRTRVDTLARLDNHDGAFEAHRSLRFAAFTAATGAATESFELIRPRDIDALGDLPDAAHARRGPVLTRAALSVLSYGSRRIPDVDDEAHLAEAVRIASSFRPLGDPGGWGAAFSRELNLTDDRRYFADGGLPVLEGKHVHPHRVDLRGVRYFITRGAAARRLPARPFDRPRLAYRDVTAATNRQTLIAAIVPAGAVTSHSLFCLRNDWDLRTQRALCEILNSAVANALMRLFVGSHVTTSLMAWLPVPPRDAAVAALAGVKPGSPEAAAVVGRLYGVV